MELIVVGESATGRSVDNSDVAVIRGTVADDQYDLQLHPVDEGASTDQDIRFRGTRARDVVTGAWEHASGARGTWTAEITALEEREALDLYRLPCADTAVARLEVRGSCAGGA